MATLTVLEITIDGVEEALVAVDAGLTDQFANTGSEYAKVDNAGGAPITVTPTITGALNTGETIEPTIVTVPNGQHRLIGPFNRNLYGSICSLVFSASAAVKVQILQLPKTAQPVVKPI